LIKNILIFKKCLPDTLPENMRWLFLKMLNQQLF